MNRSLGHKRRNPANEAPELVADDRGTTPARCAVAGRIALKEVVASARPVIVVAGAASNAGKTWVCERLLETFASAGCPARAVKVTRTHVETCPRENDGCGVCEDLSTPWRIVQDFESLNQPTKDTGRYLAAGAREVRWLIVNPDHVDAGVRSVLAGIEGGPIIVEGNSFLDHVSGVDVAVMAIGDRFRIKPSARHVLDRIDVFTGRPGTESVVAELRRMSGLPGRPWVPADDIGRWILDRLD